MTDELKTWAEEQAYERAKAEYVKELNGIRAEIEQITDTMGVSYNQYVSKIDVLQIIDKYRTESEVRNDKRRSPILYESK